MSDTRVILLIPVLFTAMFMTMVAVEADLTWPDAEQLTTYAGWDALPAIAQMNDGRIWVVWQSKGPPIGGGRTMNYDIFYKIYDWTSWTVDQPLIVDPSHDINPSIFQTEDGTIWVFWSSNKQGNYDVYYITSSNNGDTWSGSIQLTTNTDHDTNPAAIQAANGTIWVVWQRDIAGNDEIFCRIYDKSSWSGEIQLTTDQTFDRLPSIAQMNDGKIWVFWDSYTATEDFDILYRIYNGSAWSVIMQLTNSADLDVDPAVVQDRNGTIFVIWTSHEPVEDYQDDLYYKTSFDNGITWEDTVSFTSNPNEDIWSSVAQLNDKKIWVFWVSNRTGNWDIFYKTSSEILTHDVAIANVMPSSTKPYQGETISISVDAENQGDFPETFTVDCYINSTLIGSQMITLSPEDLSTIFFSWNTSTFAPSAYTVSANATFVLGENVLNTMDNRLVDGTVTVKILGDVNGNGFVDHADLSRMGLAYGAKLGDPNWDEDCDMNRDEIVDAADLFILGRNYGKTA